MTSIAPVLPKISAIIPRLATEHDGEVVGCVRAIDRLLKASGCDWHDLAAALDRGNATEPRREFHERGWSSVDDCCPPSWADATTDERYEIIYSLIRSGKLSDWETTFVNSISAQYTRRALSEKQVDVIDRLARRILGNAGDFKW